MPPRSLRTWIVLRHAGAIRGLLLIASLWMLREARTLLVPIVLALLLAVVLAPAARRLRRLGLPQAIGAALLVGALLAGGGTVAALLAEPAAQWWERAPRTLATVLSRIDRWRDNWPGGWSAEPRRGSPRAASEAADSVKARLASEGVALTGSLLGEVLRVTLSAASMVILLYFILASEPWLVSRCIEALPPRPRLRALVLGGLRALQRDLSRYIVTLSLINAGVGVATSLVMSLLSLPNPGLWGLAAALLNFVPYIGPWVTAGALVLAGAMAGAAGWPLLWPSLGFLGIHAVESNLVSPWLIGRRLALPALSVFLSVLLWAWLWGIAGALIAVPMLIGLRCLCRRNRKLRVVAMALSAGSRPHSSLGRLLASVRSTPKVPG